MGRLTSAWSLWCTVITMLLPYNSIVAITVSAEACHIWSGWTAWRILQNQKIVCMMKVTKNPYANITDMSCLHLSWICALLKLSHFFPENYAWTFWYISKQQYRIKSNGIHLKWPVSEAPRCLFSCKEFFSTTIKIVSSLLWRNILARVHVFSH